MEAVGRIKLDHPFAGFYINTGFIYVSGAESCTRVKIVLKTFVCAYGRIVDYNMGRLIFPVNRFGKINAGKFIGKKGAVQQFAVYGAGIIYFVYGFQCCSVIMGRKKIAGPYSF